MLIMCQACTQRCAGALERVCLSCARHACSAAQVRLSGRAYHACSAARVHLSGCAYHVPGMHATQVNDPYRTTYAGKTSIVRFRSWRLIGCMPDSV